MYLDFYQLHEPPFSLTPDTSFFFPYGPHYEALETLLVTLEGGEGFIKVIGEVGTGKTLLCRKLLNTLDEKRFITAYIPNPNLTPAALIFALSEELELQYTPRHGAYRTIKGITQRLIELSAEGLQVVLCIDEAQAMPTRTLETLRLLTNLETEKRKLLHVVLFGQPELNEKLAHPSIRQLRQRITFSYTLQPIDRNALAAYVDHRLATAGACGTPSFDDSALQQLFRGSGGFPRLVNILSHKALMLGYGQGEKVIQAHHVRQAIDDTEGALKGGEFQRMSLLFGLSFVALLSTTLLLNQAIGG